MGGRRIISHSRYKILPAVLSFLVLMSNTILDTKISDGNNSTAKSKHLKGQLGPLLVTTVGNPVCDVFAYFFILI